MSDRKLATIARILSVEPIEGADNLELAKIRGWQCVIKKGDFKEGDLACYYEIDSFLPIEPQYEFLRKNCYRKMQDGTEGFKIKTMRLRGCLSQGLLLPLSLVFGSGMVEGIPIEEDQDLTEILKVKKWDDFDGGSAYTGGDRKGNFPNWLIKTDEERIQNMRIRDIINKDYYVSEKLDGSSFTCYLKDGEFGVCSRNYDIMPTEGNVYWEAARELGLEEKLRHFNHPNVALQGELVGPGIQKNYYRLPKRTLYFFSLLIDGLKVPFNVFQSTLSALDLTTVPIIDECFHIGPEIFASDLLTKAEGKAIINPDIERGFGFPDIRWKYEF